MKASRTRSGQLWIGNVSVGRMGAVILGLGLLVASPGSELLRAENRQVSASVPAQSARQSAAEFVLKDLAGKEVKLSSFKGKVVILDFWATWCPPCRKGIPDLIDLYSTYQKQGLEVVGISFDQNGAVAVGPYAKDKKINYTMLLLAGSPTGQTVAKQYVPSGKIPTMHILDKRGRIVESFTGVQPKETVESIVQALLRES